MKNDANFIVHTMSPYNAALPFALVRENFVTPRGLLNPVKSEK